MSEFKVKAPKGCADYYVEGKVYDAKGLTENLFELFDDGIVDVCRYKKCGHLNGGDWEIVKEQDS